MQAISFKLRTLILVFWTIALATQLDSRRLLAQDSQDAGDARLTEAGDSTDSNTYGVHAGAEDVHENAVTNPRNVSDRAYSDREYPDREYPDQQDDAQQVTSSRYSASYPTDLESEYQPVYDSENGKYRQPVAIVFVDTDTALIPTKLAGEIYEFDLRTRTVQIGFSEADSSWGDLVRLDSQTVAVAELTKSQIVVLSRSGGAWHVLTRLDAPGHPNALAWDAGQETLLASGRWSQRLYSWTLDRRTEVASGTAVEKDGPAADFGSWTHERYVDLPMCGGQVLPLPARDVILVIDAFGRDYAVVGRDDFAMHHHAQVYGHNIRAIAADADETMVFFPHQLLNEFARTVRTDITWGGLMSNNIRWLQTDRLLTMSGEDIFKKGNFYPLGTPGNGAGDPSSMAVSETGKIAVTLAGTNRVTISNEDDYYFRQAAVGMRPVDCAYANDDSLLVVVNQFSDSISIIDVDSLEVEHISLGALRSPTQVEKGEQLFFNSRLAHDGWMSCNSCHSDGHTNGQLNDNFTDHSFGTPKRVLSLLGQAETMPYAWSGDIDSLEEQVAHSIVSTMASNRAPSDDTVAAIAKYIRTLPAPPSLHAARQFRDTSVHGIVSQVEQAPRSTKQHYQIDLGRKVFASEGCADCHAGSRLTAADVFDVGLVDEDDRSKFNPPSLIAVSQRSNALLHDARARSLRDVIVVQRHQVSSELSNAEIDALITYLESL